MARNIFHRNQEETPVKRILVPVKGSGADEEAMKLASTYALAKMGKGRNVLIQVVYVVEVPHALALNTEMDAAVEKGEKALDNVEAAVRDLGLQVDVSIINARDAGAAIVDVSRESGSELIVMATDYMKKLGEVDLGRTIPYVLKNASCRVWVCRAPMSSD